MTALSHEGCSPEAINVACAERLGWTQIKAESCPSGMILFGYPADVMNPEGRCCFFKKIDGIVKDIEGDIEVGGSLSAAICEAFLKLPPCP